ncbi:MAG: trypsin-like peptidase domain-containing protein [Bacteroidota bacterium]
MKKLFSLLAVSFLGGILALAASRAFENKQSHFTSAAPRGISFEKASYRSSDAVNGPDFVDAAAKSVHAVVHIKTSYQQKNNYYDSFFQNFFNGGSDRPYQATGSGVILTADGYIVTNNHVVEDADLVEVTLNDKRTYQAEVVGSDPTTDIALIRIKESKLPFVSFGNSDSVRIGEWVLAVGNPFNLTSTVTAGIISAKARNINILGSQGAIESFLQTDAVVNPGNSGGALVNTSGDLIGINAAIASNTGSYTGYSFAIPSNIVKKVVEDLVQFGEVQRAYLGINPVEVTDEFARDNKLDEIRGVYLNGLTDNGGAKEAGLAKGDVIISLNKTPVNSVSEFLEVVGQHRPGEKLDVTYLRDGKEMSAMVVLKNKEGTLAIVKKVDRDLVGELGADFKELSPAEKQWLGANIGLKVTNLRTGLLKTAGVGNNFIITGVDRQLIRNQDDLKKALTNKKGGVLVEGIYPNRLRGWYTIVLKE